MKVKRSIVTVAPVLEPIDRDSIGKLDLKLEAGTTEDALLNIWIQAAREKIEERTGLSLITQTRVIKLDHFPRGCDGIELLYGPVQSVVVTYQDDDDATQTLSSSDYWLDTHGPGRITIKNSWPSTMDRPAAVTITYVAGFGLTAATVPGPLRSAVLMRFAHLYENRQSVVPGAMDTVPLGEDDLVFPYVMTQNASY